jgi:hypothetical protein
LAVCEAPERRDARSADHFDYIEDARIDRAVRQQPHG